MKSWAILFLFSFTSCALFGPQKIEDSKEELFLIDFKSDGCSAFPNGHLLSSKSEWLHCCFVHDLSYWYGGSRDQKIYADKELNECVSEVTTQTQGELMEIGVEVGGSPQSGLPWRWGYGWNIEVPYMEIDGDKVEKMKKKFSSVSPEFERWKEKLSPAQRFYIKEKIAETKEALFSTEH